MRNDPFIIVISGAESTGKTSLAGFLAGHYGVDYIPEYARGYIENLGRPYIYDDVEHIAQRQSDLLEEAIRSGKKLIILDTYLVITKIWFREVFGRVPDWLQIRLESSQVNLFLLCDHDIEWVEDPVRENPGERRAYLSDQYRKEILNLGMEPVIVRGRGSAREQNALEGIKQQFPQLNNIL